MIQAWEFLGTIMEKESAFKDAAENYEKAWELQNQSAPAVGFKLAFNCMQAFCLDHAPMSCVNFRCAHLYRLSFSRTLILIRFESEALCRGDGYLPQSASHQCRISENS